MSDNVTLDGGIVVATDEIDGVHTQRTKITHGVDGASTDTSASNPLPVVQTGELPAGDNLIGEVDVNEFPASSRTTDTVGATTDAVSVANGLDALTVKFASISTAASGHTSLVSAVSGKKIRVLSYALVAAGAVTAQFASASSARSGAMPLGENGGVSAQAPQGLLETAAGEALRINLGGAVQVSGHLSYIEV